MTKAFCSKCQVWFTFTSVEERDRWLKRHPKDHKVEK